MNAMTNRTALFETKPLFALMLATRTSALAQTYLDWSINSAFPSSTASAADVARRATPPKLSLELKADIVIETRPAYPASPKPLPRQRH